MAITFAIPTTEVVITTGQTTVLGQDLLNAIREFEDDFAMMSHPHIASAEGKAPLGGGVFTEIVLRFLNPWTIRFEDEGSAHTSVTGCTLLATDAIGDPRPVTTNYALTINQSISGTLVESATSGLTSAEASDIAGIEANSAQLLANLADVARFLSNAQGTDPATGRHVVMGDDGVTPWRAGDAWEDYARTTQYGPASTAINFRDALALVTGGGVDVESITLSKTAHGFSVGQLIGYDDVGVDYVLSLPGTYNARAIVSDVPDSNTFTLFFGERIRIPGHGHTVGAELFGHQSTPGAMITTEPTSGHRQRVGHVATDDDLVMNYGEEIDLG